LTNILIPRTKGFPRYATAAPTVQAPAQPRGPQPEQRPAQARPQAAARPGAALVQIAVPAQANRQAVAASVQSRAQFIPSPPPAAVASVTALVSGSARVISHPPQAATVPSDIESLKTRLDQAESDKNALEKQLDEKDGALKSAQKTQIDMAKMLGERKGEIDNAKWQIEDLEMAKADLEKELAKKKLATTPDEGLAVQAASDKKALEEVMRQKEESARRAEKKLAEAEARFETAEARANAAERQLAEAQCQVQTLTTELSSQKQLFTQAEGEVEDQKKLYEVAKNEASQLRVAVNKLEASNRARTAQCATSEEEKQAMKVEMTKLTERSNDSLHAANAAQNEIEDQKLEVAIKSITSTESIAVVAREQVEQTKAEEQESIPGIIPELITEPSARPLHCRDG
jgi:chromosome segregation ATPase